MVFRFAWIVTWAALGLARAAAAPPAPDAAEIAPRPGPTHHKPVRHEKAGQPGAGKADPHAKQGATDPKAQTPPVEAAIPPPSKPAKESADPPPKIPRFAALKTDETNMRKGPGQRYPIEWVYRRRDLPVEVQREYDVWRLVRDPEGIQGWVHQVTLSERRTFMVKDKDATIRTDAGDQAPGVALLKAGVIGRLRACAAGSAWCQVQVGTFKGYLRRDQVWGLLPGEVVGDS